MDLGSLLSDAGVSVGSLTFNVVLRGLLILLVGLILIRIILAAFDRAAAKSEKFSAVGLHLRPIVKALLTILLILVVLGSLGVQVTSFIALLSVAGLAVSLALQTALSNVAGGLTIMTSQPYSVGDYVSIEGTEGIVDRISLSFTKLTTLDNKEVHIPNSHVASAKITNFNRLGRRRVDLTFTASYNTPTQAVKDAIADAVASFPQVMSNPAPVVYLSEYGSSSISYISRVWVNAADYWDVYFGLLERVRETFAAHGVEMTYDHLNVHVVNG